jgi:hypothetical protein
MRGRLWVCVGSHAAVNKIYIGDIACLFGLILSVIWLPLVSLSIDCKPSDCIRSSSWRQTGFAIPADDVVSQDWGAVLKHLQKEVRICIIAEFAPSLRPYIPLFKVRLHCNCLP